MDRKREKIEREGDTRELKREVKEKRSIYISKVEIY